MGTSTLGVKEKWQIACGEKKKKRENMETDGFI